jgi:hypothetical protein
VDSSPDTEQLASHFASAAPGFASSPLYQSFCPAVAADSAVLRLLTQRRPGQQPSFLLFGAVHYLLLAGAQHPLRGYYPSLAGEGALDPGDAGPVLLDFCHAHHAELADLIRSRLVQTNVVRRSAAVLLIMWAVRQRCGQPVHLIEIGASAGIHLRFDRYRYVIGGQVFGRAESAVVIETRWRGEQPPPGLDDLPPVSSRTGVDLHPVSAGDDGERQWLRALVWPENGRDAALLTAALDGVASDPPAMIAGDAVEVCPALAQHLPAGEPRVVFHIATRMHVPAGRRAAFDTAIDALGDTAPLYHAWMEPPSAQHHGLPPLQPDMVMMHGPGGTLVPLAPAGGHLEWMGPVQAAAWQAAGPPG